MTMGVNRGRLPAGVSSAVALIILVGGFFLLIRGGKTAFKPTAERHSQRAPSRLVSPFTGEPIAKLGPELIFKIDNAPQARPPTGLPRADIRYLLPVNGGLSPIFAAFSSHSRP